MHNNVHAYPWVGQFGKVIEIPQNDRKTTYAVYILYILIFFHIKKMLRIGCCFSCCDLNGNSELDFWVMRCENFASIAYIGIADSEDSCLNVGSFSKIPASQNVENVHGCVWKMGT